MDVIQFLRQITHNLLGVIIYVIANLTALNLQFIHLSENEQNAETKCRDAIDTIVQPNECDLEESDLLK